MKLQKKNSLLSSLQRYVEAACLISIGVGGIVLLGWFLDIGFLKSILPNAATMKFNTALCFLLLGISLWFLKNEESQTRLKYTGQIFAGVAVLISTATIGEYLFGWDLGIDQMLTRDLATLPVNFPGRMSQITAICFVLIGIALLLIDTNISQYFSISVILLSLLAVIGYLFDYQALYQLGGYGTVALHTAITFLILSVAIFFVRPYLGLMKIGIGEPAGSHAIRVLVPFTVFLTILLGWLVEAGEDIHIFNPGNKVAVLVVLLIVIYSPLIYFYASRINRADEQIIRLNRLYATLSHVNQTIVHAKDQQELFENICKVTVEHSRFALAWIGLLDEDSGDVQPVTAAGLDINPWPFPMVNIHHGAFKDGLIAKAIRTSKVTTSDDVQVDNILTNLYDQFQKYAYHSAAAVPFRLKGKTIGVASLISNEMGFFKSKEEVRLLNEVGVDISFALDTIQQEKERKLVEEQFQLAIQSAPNAIILIDMDGQIILTNKRVETYFGYHPNELAGKSVEILVPERLRNGHLGYRAGFMANPQVRPMGKGRDLYGLRKNGSEFPVEIGLAPFETSEGMLVMATIVDITERKQAENEIKRQLNRLNSLHEIDLAITSSFDIHVTLDIVLQQVIARLNVDGAVILLFDSHTQTLEYAVGKGFQSHPSQHTRLKLGEGFASRIVLERRAIHILDLKTAGAASADALRLVYEDFTEYYGVPLIVKGDVKGVLEVYHRTSLSRGEYWLGYLETLAEQAAIAIDNAQLFERLQHAKAELEQRVEERTRELIQTNLELEHANHAKSDFLATMSHELRSPLNSILGLSESLLEERRDPLSEHQQQSLQIIASSGRHLLELINDILDLSKIEAGKLDYYPQVVGVNALCWSSLSFVKEQAMRKSIHLEFDEGREDFNIHADPRRLKQILINLLTNAVKFTQDGGRVTLQVHADAEEDLIQFSVIDNGIGIADEDFKKLFQPFVQVDSNLNRQFEGTGLGLALIQRLTDLHGGSVYVESEPGRGSRFVINIPWGRDLIAQQASSELEHEPRADEQSEGSSSRGAVLLAEDNMANVLTVGEYLKSHGYEVLVAHNGLEAIEKTEETNPDIILMDIQMPAMDGLEATRRLRADHRFASTPIIALTALAMPGDRKRCLEAGATEYMSKPVSLKKLVKTISKLITVN